MKNIDFKEIFFVFICITSLSAKDIYISTGGNDSGSGSLSSPYASLKHALDQAGPGDSCILTEGVYRESVSILKGGEKDSPLIIKAAPGKKVVMSGLEAVNGKWEKYKKNIYRLRLEQPVSQLFGNKKMLIEARWPDMSFGEHLQRDKWAAVSAESRYGFVVNKELADSGIDWAGTPVMLNIGHQFFSYGHNISSFDDKSGTLYYETNLHWLAHLEHRARVWQDDYFYLWGRLELLDSPGEWHYEDGYLYLWPQDGKKPADNIYEIKARTYAVKAANIDYIQISGIDFFGSTIELINCSGVMVDKCTFLYPAYATAPLDVPVTRLFGSNNVFKNSLVAFTPGTGLEMIGTENRIENCIIHDVSWFGSLKNPALSVYPYKKLPGFKKKDWNQRVETDRPTIIKKNTIYNCGNAGINYRNQEYIVEYNHVFNCGLVCKDVAAIYTGQPSVRGSIVRYNHVHDCYADDRGGIGIRGDDQTRGLQVHHNVVWNCGLGMIIKGDDNYIYNNTLYVKGKRGGLEIPTRSEPLKKWRKQHPLLSVQNSNSYIFNNAAWTLIYRKKPLPPSERISHNLVLSDIDGPLFADAAAGDFRPAPGSRLIDAGRVLSGYMDLYKGKAPDLGAYEAAAGGWQAGAAWEEEYLEAGAK